MRNKNVTQIFTGLYSVARKTGLLEQAWLRRAFVGSSFLYKRWYEDPFWDLVQRMPELFQGGDVLDIGANIGYTASVFARALQAPAKVYAFEPDPSTYSLLEEVIKRRGLLRKVEPINLAAGNCDGYLEFWHNKDHSADHRVVTDQFRSSRPDASDFTRVQVTTVDSFVAARNLQKVSFIKIDVQGYELAVCEGLKDTLQRFPKVIICLEFAPEAMIELGFNPSLLLEFFRSKCYYTHLVTRGPLRVVSDSTAMNPLLQHGGYVDLLFSKRAHA
jgi:FkbM family methyltransferase